MALIVDPALRSRQGERIPLLLDGHAYVEPSASPAQVLDRQRTHLIDGWRRIERRKITGEE